MNYSEKVNAAIERAAILHRDQVRLTPERVPYIAHIFAVYSVLSQYTNDEDTLVAGILHDAIEDTEYTLKELEKDFGGQVRSVVAGVTEPKYDVYGNKLPWKVRKVAYLENLRRDSQESMLVCVADKICNLRALEADYRVYGDNLWGMLTASFEDKMWYHDEVVKILERRMHNRHALRDLKQVLSETKATIKGAQDNKNKKAANFFSKVLSRLNPLRLGVLSARISGYGKRNTN